MKVDGTFRFDGPTSIASGSRAKRLRKRTPRLISDSDYFGADANFFTNARGRWPIELYADSSENPGVTLTRKEADLVALANPGKRPPRALEVLHPWLPQQYYTSNSDENYKNIRSVIHKFGHHLVAPDVFCDLKWNTVCNSIRMTTDLDAMFYTAWHLPIQDAYVLEERRPNRHVIAIDFNAMYPSCMQKEFPKPSKMKRISYQRYIVPDEALPIGLYRCKISCPSSNFILKYNPFRSFFHGRYLRASLSRSVVVDLHDFEVSFYFRHFEKIYVTDAIVSDERVSHPLARDARRSFSRRMHYLTHGNVALAGREKFLSTLLVSCTHRPQRVARSFASSELAEAYLSNTFGISCSVEDLENLSGRWLHGRKGVTVERSTEGILCVTPNLKNQSACFAFNQRIVAWSRVVLLEMMQRVLNLAPDVEICYSNIDSLHFSIPSEFLDSVVDRLKRQASGRMGGYKIEAVTNCGLWLEPGRYWLYSSDIEKFRNRSIGSRGGPFSDHSVHVASRKIGHLHIPIRMNISIERSMSDIRSIIDDPHTGLARQRLIEINGDSVLSDILRSLEDNRIQGNARRLEAFKRLAELHEGCRDLLPQDPTAEPGSVSAVRPPNWGVFDEHSAQKQIDRADSALPQ